MFENAVVIRFMNACKSPPANPRSFRTNHRQAAMEAGVGRARRPTEPHRVSLKKRTRKIFRWRDGSPAGLAWLPSRGFPYRVNTPYRPARFACLSCGARITHLVQSKDAMTYRIARTDHQAPQLEETQFESPTGAATDALPDAERCGARLYAAPDVVECVAERPTWCEHVLYFGEGFFCTHPHRAKIVARTHVG